jgi:hypothetical protein
MKTKIAAFAALVSGSGFVLWPVAMAVANKTAPEYFGVKIFGGVLVAALSVLVLWLQRNTAQIATNIIKGGLNISLTLGKSASRARTDQ